jgi:hypothetical protein
MWGLFEYTLLLGFTNRNAVCMYCDRLLKALRYGTRKTHVIWSTVELRLLNSEGLNNHDDRELFKTSISRQQMRKQVSVTTAR